ncbi:Hypothetical_protein [Hexamita inflata]|nr:Hypothetical protein HINF_LOCUS60745 [Hexamita inflata]
MVPVDLKAAYIKITASGKGFYRVDDILQIDFNEPNSKPQIESRVDTKANIPGSLELYFLPSCAQVLSHHTVLFFGFEIDSKANLEFGLFQISTCANTLIRDIRIIFSSHTYLLNNPKYHEMTVFTETKLLTVFPTTMIIIVFHLDRMNSLVAEQLKENIALLQAIHEANHKIVELEFQHDRAQRVRWTAQEDALLRYSAGAFGSDLVKIQAVMVSKTKKQIYFRILYQNRQQAKAE